jgi:hypothetical protein
VDSERPGRRTTTRGDGAARWRGWRPWAWVVLVHTTLVGTAVVLGLATLIGLSGVSVCGQPPDPREVAHAQRSLAVLALVALLPWLLAAVWVRPRLRVVVAGLVVSAPAWLSWVQGHLDPQTYSLTWCF